jgi:hypothetical protein
MGSSFATWKRCNKQRLHDVAIGPLKNAVRWVGTNDCHAAATAKRFCPMAIISWRSMRNNWAAEKEDQTIMRTLGYILLAPILLVLAVIAGFALFSAFGWLATIPSWAAVIIILLVLIYVKK